MGDCVGGSLPKTDHDLGCAFSVSYEELKRGEHTLEIGRCYACGKIERAEGENHSYFITDDNGNKQFVSKECWFKTLAGEIEKNPYISPKVLKKIEEKKRIIEEEKAMEVAANFLI